tara:strand:+ start:765 stop:1280 length:516 start_codon:yes stop_codon:yes gene_type:complete
MGGGIILALDLATRTGFAIGPVLPAPRLVGKGEAKPQSGAKSFEGSVGKSLAGLSRFVYDLIEEHKPTLIVFEAPLDPRHLKGKTKKIAGRRLIAMAGLIEMIAFQKQIPVREVPPHKIKKHWTGNGSASKGDMLNVCALHGWNVTDDNEADALALLDYTAGMLRLEEKVK